jgi:hypothetical protein
MISKAETPVIVSSGILKTTISFSAAGYARPGHPRNLIGMQPREVSETATNGARSDLVCHY